MLTYEQIITLSDKGFSPDQIVMLNGEDIPDPAAEPVQEPAAEPVQEPAAEPVQEPAAKPVQEPAAESGSPLSVLQEAFKGFSAELAEMKKALQASNIRNVIREDISPSKSADDILAEMIHPTINKEGNKK